MIIRRWFRNSVSWNNNRWYVMFEINVRNLIRTVRKQGQVGFVNDIVIDERWIKFHLFVPVIRHIVVVSKGEVDILFVAAVSAVQFVKNATGHRKLVTMHVLYHSARFNEEKFVGPLDVSDGPKVDALVVTIIHIASRIIFIIG